MVQFNSKLHKGIVEMAPLQVTTTTVVTKTLPSTEFDYFKHQTQK